MCAKKVGLLGSGEVSKTLASGFIKHGYEVMIGTSDKAKLADWQIKNTKGKVGSFLEAAGFGDIVVLAVKSSVRIIRKDCIGEFKLQQLL